MICGDTACAIAAGSGIVISGSGTPADPWLLSTTDPVDIIDIENDIANLQADLDTTSTSWGSPISSGVTVGSGTTSGSYTQVGKTVTCYMGFVLGAGSAITGDILINLPVTAVATGAVHGLAVFNDAGTAVFLGDVTASTINLAVVRARVASSTYVQPGLCSATIPFTWVSGDSFSVTITYMAA